VIRRQTWLIPAQDQTTLMRPTVIRPTVIRPPGEGPFGPFPLAAINHGSTQNEMRRADHRLPQYDTLALWLVHAPQAVAVWGPIVERLLQSMT